MNKNCKNCPYQSEVYKDLTDKQLELVNNHRFEIEYAPGEVIFKQGANCTHVVSFIAGLAKMYIETPGHEDALIRLVKPHEFIACSGLFLSELNRFSLKALEPSKACLIDAFVIKQLIDENTVFANKMLRHFQKNMAFTLDRMLSFYLKHHSGRIAETLLYLSEEIYNQNPFHLSLSKKDIASLAGVSRENAQRILKSLIKDGIIRLNGKTLEILDVEMLRQIAANG